MTIHSPAARRFGLAVRLAALLVLVALGTSNCHPESDSADGGGVSAATDRVP